MLPHRQGDRPPGVVNLLRQLDAGGRRPHHQHPAFRQIGGTAVVIGGHRVDEVGQPGGQLRNFGQVEPAGGQHRRTAVPNPLVGHHLEPVVGGAQGGYPGVGAHRGVRQPAVAVDEPDDFRHGHIPVRVGAVVGEAGQPGQPVGGEQAQRIPTLGAPRLGHLPPLQHHMVDGALGEEPAYRQAGVPGPDYDGGGPHRLRRPRRSRWSGW